MITSKLQKHTRLSFSRKEKYMCKGVAINVTEKIERKNSFCRNTKQKHSHKVGNVHYKCVFLVFVKES